MKRAAGAVALLALLAVACGGDDDNNRADTTEKRAQTPTPSTEPDEPDPPVLAPDQAQAALLTVQDFPTGYASVPSTFGESSETEGLCNGPNLVARTTGATAVASAEFARNTTSGDGFHVAVFGYSDEDGAERLIASTKALSESCSSFLTPLADGTPATATVGALSFPQIGDETLAFRTTINDTPETVVAITESVYARVGTVVVVIEQNGLYIDTAETERVARLAVSRVESTLSTT
jgi:hypothetical protein